jgi:hypothetical protein
MSTSRGGRRLTRLSDPRRSVCVRWLHRRQCGPERAGEDLDYRVRERRPGAVLEVVLEGRIHPSGAVAVQILLGLIAPLARLDSKPGGASRARSLIIGAVTTDGRARRSEASPQVRANPPGEGWVNWRLARE